MDNHIEGCACFEGSCCPWMGGCICQCTCDILSKVESRSYKRGYSDALDSITGDIVDKAYNIGYKEGINEAKQSVADLFIHKSINVSYSVGISHALNAIDGLDCD